MMSSIHLILFRGLPGSGKTTLARVIADEVFSADDFFVHDGVYKYDPTRIQEAHEHCAGLLSVRMSTGRKGILAVANTFSRKWEMDRYIDTLFGSVGLHVVDLFDAGYNDEELAQRCVHGVPAAFIGRMRERWEK